MQIAVLTPADVTPNLLAAFHRLMPQLSDDPLLSLLSLAQLEDIVRSPATQILVAREAGQALIGTLTLAHYRTPSGAHWWIEDVVVDAAHRGRGIGEALSHAALQHAKSHGASAVNLTSRPSRVAANRLYLKLGFVRRETNVYRFDLAGSADDAAGDAAT